MGRNIRNRSVVGGERPWDTYVTGVTTPPKRMEKNGRKTQTGTFSLGARGSIGHPRTHWRPLRLPRRIDSGAAGRHPTFHDG
jgi:hypothetical protein